MKNLTSNEERVLGVIGRVAIDGHPNEVIYVSNERVENVCSTGAHVEEIENMPIAPIIEKEMGNVSVSIHDKSKRLTYLKTANKENKTEEKIPSTIQRDLLNHKD